MFRDFTPRHTKRYVDMGNALESSVKSYINDVVEGSFPTEKNSFTVEDEVVEALEKLNL
jgi:3-methyl-2-oxobutanoate hydroxymethyltransferase